MAHATNTRPGRYKIQKIYDKIIIIIPKYKVQLLHYYRNTQYQERWLQP